MASSAGSDFHCDSCGAEVHPNARACSRCGFRLYSTADSADRESFWRQDDHLDGTDLPGDEDDFDYADFVAQEFGTPNESRQRKWLSDPFADGRKVFWWVIAVITLLAFILMVVGYRYW